jgi:hypothetical protein
MSRRRRSATDRAGFTAVAALLALVLGGCSDEGTKIPAEAVSEASGIVGSSAHDALALGPADVERLATIADVEPEVIESTASALGDSAVWTQSMDGVRTIYDEAPEGVESTLTDVVCSAQAGRVYTDHQLHYAIYPRVDGYDTAEINGLTEAAFDLFRVLLEANGSDREEDRAAAALTCHTLEETGL